MTKTLPLVRHLFARLLAACSIDASVQMSIETITEPEGCPFWWVDPFLKKKQVSNFASQFDCISSKYETDITFQQLIQIRKVHQTCPHFATSESTHRNGNTQGPNQVEDATDMGRPEDCGWCGWLFLKWMHPKQPWNLNTYKWCDYKEITWYSKYIYIILCIYSII